MKTTVLGVMRTHLDKEEIVICNENMPKLLEGLKRFAGAEAGICYMSKPYFDSYVSDEVKALNRFGTVAPTGHHSIAGHSQIAVLFEGIPKILAMYLNNLTDYETSEKSGRYTVMTGNTPKEIEVYEKWCSKIKDLIFEEYDDKIDDRTRDKLAKENARYLLSVFTPTTMGYTTSLRQFNYIIDWTEKFNNKDLPNNYFYNTLKKYFLELASQLRELLYVEELRDFKNRDGLSMINPYEVSDISELKEQFGKMYTINYKGSFAEYAQAQRHRTLFYNMYFDGISREFYIPPIIAQNAEVTNEWIEDMKSVSEYVPTGTKVLIEESGKIDYFYLKSMERNCGRAQLEIMQQNLESAEKLRQNMDSLVSELDLSDYYKSDKEGHVCPKMKGQLLVCKEPCIWGCEGARSRKI